ncbi:MAG: muramoyltetrapeptide carboxypeptidase [Calditrichia bacterium]
MQRLFEKIGLFHPAGQINREQFIKGKHHLQKLSDEIIEFPLELDSDPLVARNDVNVLKEWNYFAERKDIPYLIASRGGVGSTRLVRELMKEELSLLHQILIGFSDLTSLFWYLLVEYDKPSIYGPVVQYHFANYPQWTTYNHFFELIKSEKSWNLHLDKLQGMVHSSRNEIYGTLLPVCLSIFSENYIPEKRSDKFIMVVEDINEKAYKIYRYIQLLEIKGFLTKVEAVLLGDFTNTDNQVLVETCFEEICTAYSIPLFKGIPFGHHLNSESLPFGVPARLIVDEQRLECDLSAMNMY